MPVAAGGCLHWVLHSDPPPATKRRGPRKIIEKFGLT